MFAARPEAVQVAVAPDASASNSLSLLAVSDCPVTGVAGEAGEPLTVQVKVVVPAPEFTVTLAMVKSPS